MVRQSVFQNFRCCLKVREENETEHSATQSNEGGLDVSQLLKKQNAVTSSALVDACSRENSSAISNASTEGTEFSVSENWQLMAPLAQSHKEKSWRK